MCSSPAPVLVCIPERVCCTFGDTALLPYQSGLERCDNCLWCQANVMTCTSSQSCSKLVLAVHLLAADSLGLCQHHKDVRLLR